MTGHARITIELEPAPRSGRWVTRTRVEEPGHAAAEPLRVERPAEAVHVPEPREPAVEPVGYEAPTECTCVEGLCDVDHANA